MNTIKDNGYSLIINPTLDCNFKCWYCYQKHPKERMSNETIDKVKKHIRYMVEEERIPRLHLGWFGGEPLLYFNEVIFPISTYAKELCEQNRTTFHCSITTNASKIDQEMIERMKKIDLTTFQITLDGPPQKHNTIRNEDGKPSFDIILNNVVAICNNIDRAVISLRINYDNKTLKESGIHSIFDRIPPHCRSKITPNFQRVWQTVKKRDGVTENQERIALVEYTEGLGFSSGNIANIFSVGFKSYKCYADRLSHTEINYDGKIYSCTARGYTDDRVVGELLESGVIKWDEHQLAKKITKSTFENNHCLRCKYLPLCFGPCSQKVKETSPENFQSICALNISEVSPETVILHYFKQKEKLSLSKTTV